MRILKRNAQLKDLVSQVLTFDYLGALAVSIAFPLVLVPHLGLVRSSFLFGALNVLVALLTLQLLRRQVTWARSLQSAGVIILVGMGAGIAYSEKLLAWSERSTYADTVIFARSTAYQRIVITREANDLRLYLNNNLQFSSRDEYRYHEALVHPGLARLAHPQDVLVLGGGDGIAVREVLKYPTVTNIVPARWFIVIARGIMLKGTGLGYLWHETLVLAGMALLLLVAATRSFHARLD